MNKDTELIIEFEKNIQNFLEGVMKQILSNLINSDLNGKNTRIGASVSEELQKRFKKYINDEYVIKNKEIFKDVSIKKNVEVPKANETKNPWDAKIIIEFNSENKQQLEIWIDFKALKFSEQENSNPDMGTINKVIDKIICNNIQLVYIFVYYKNEKNGHLTFDHDKINIFFLKNISEKVRRNPKNQLQINWNDSSVKYRSNEEFAKLIIKKFQESLERDKKNNEYKTKKLNENKNKMIQNSIKKDQDITDILRKIKN